LRSERRVDFSLFGRARPVLAGNELLRARWAAWRVLDGERASSVAQAMHLPATLIPRLERVGRPLPEALSVRERVALEGSVPDFVAELLVDERGEKEALEIVRALSVRAPLTVRTNVLKTVRERLLKRLAAEKVTGKPTRFSPWGIALETHLNAFGLGSFQDGLFEIQDEGSQLLALLLQARPGERVVDACAGAGGKTLALSGEMHNKGELFAMDVDSSRLTELARRARRAGAHNIRTRTLPEDEKADAALADLVGKADRVLVDAPCSGLGALRRNPDARYRLKPEDLVRYPKLQRELVERFARLVRPGGRLVYATCSLARAEDEAVVESFLAAHPEFVTVAASHAGVPKTLCEGAFLRTFPHRHGTDGFFAAVLERTAKAD
jgi:16S rRNA (cytosine967-C5)-methyltransferase